MSFTVLSWNVEHFKGASDDHADDIAGFIKQYTPDVIAIYELEDSHGGFIFAQTHFNEFLTFITEGQNNQEILILIKSSRFDHVAVTQQHKFKIGNPYLRPGALVTLTQEGIYTNLLFLHSASGVLGDAFGDRLEIINHVFSLNKRLQEIEENSGQVARLVVTGDFNTMGLHFPRDLVSHRVQHYQDEVAGIAHLASRAHRKNFQGMTFAAKEHDLTFSNPKDQDQGDLDHVLVSAGISLVNRGNRPSDGTPFQVSVQGWIQQPSGQVRDDFINTRSDHCALVFEVA